MRPRGLWVSAAVQRIRLEGGLWVRSIEARAWKRDRSAEDWFTLRLTPLKSSAPIHDMMAFLTQRRLHPASGCRAAACAARGRGNNRLNNTDVRYEVRRMR